MGVMSISRLTLPVWLCALAGIFALTEAPAPAAVTHAYLSRITEIPVEGPHGESVPFPGLLGGVNAMTSDSGHVWVAERRGSGGESYRVDEFDAASGAFVSQLPQVPSLSYLYQGIAVAHATGEVYVGGDEKVGEIGRCRGGVQRGG
jgi:hypothetical protein